MPGVRAQLRPRTRTNNRAPIARQSRPASVRAMSTRAERANEAEVEAAEAGRGPETADGLLESPSLADVRLLRASASEPALRALVARQVGGLQRALGNQHVLRLLHGEGGWNAEHAEPRGEEAASSGPAPRSRSA